MVHSKVRPKDIQHYLNKGYIVTVTGSKFLQVLLMQVLFTQKCNETNSLCHNPLPKGLTNIIIILTGLPLGFALLNYLKVTIMDLTCVGMQR
jgi:hypothetical protein